MEHDALPIDREELLSRYDHGELQYAMAYGSGAVRQNGYKKDEKPMIDFVFAVEDAQAWHRKNIATNPGDYSFLSYLGAGAVSRVQEWGAGVYYNPYVRLGDREIKYGVIETRRLLADLTDWETLYVAGRMHKPVETVKQDRLVQYAQHENQRHAVNTARLLLPTRFTREELYRTITGLSYAGDVRMGVGENPHKVENIVAANFDRLQEMYEGTLSKQPDLTHLGDGRLEQSEDPASQHILLDQLPANLRGQLPKKTDAMNTSDTLASNIRSGLKSIVGQSSLAMTLKGLLTAGPLKSLRYVSEKIRKRAGSK